MTRFALIALLALAGCATDGEPRVITREVLVPTPVPCAAPEPAEPARIDTNEALRNAPGLFDRVQILLAGREQRIASESEARVWGRACAR